MFTTLEHSERMLKTTGDKRDFKTVDFKDKRVRLQQAIASVFEESVCPGGQTPLACAHHDALVKALRRDDAIVSFNYDCLIDDSLKRVGGGKWNAHYGYGFELARGGGGNLRGDHHWSPSRPSTRDATITLLKLHGSLHFIVDDRVTPASVHLKERPYTRQRGNLRFTIIPPESQKAVRRRRIRAALEARGAGVVFLAEHRRDRILVPSERPPFDGAVPDEHEGWALTRAHDCQPGPRGAAADTRSLATRCRAADARRRVRHFQGLLRGRSQGVGSIGCRRCMRQSSSVLICDRIDHRQRAGTARCAPN